MKPAIAVHAHQAASPPTHADSAKRDASLLGQASPALKERLLRMIESGGPHLILSGSDPKDAHGCCPESLVGAANRLVEAGILDRWRRPGPIGSCPVTVYAFRGEISKQGRQPVFTVNANLRRSLRPALRGERRRARFLVALRAGLLAFVFATVLVIAFGTGVRTDGRSGAEVLTAGLPREDMTVLVLFRTAVRCRFCEHMDAYAREGLSAQFAGPLRDERIAYREIEFDSPEYRDLRGAFGFASTTLVLFEVRGGKAVRWKILEDAWQLTEDRDAFLEMIGREVAAFREAPHD